MCLNHDYRGWLWKTMIFSIWTYRDGFHSLSCNHKNWTMIMGDDYDTQGYRCRLWFFLDGSWWFSEDRFHSPSWNHKKLNYDYGGWLWWTMIFSHWKYHDGFLKIAFIVHHKIKIIIVQKMSELWLQGMTMKTMIFSQIWK